MIPSSRLREVLRALLLDAANHPRIGYLCSDTPLHTALAQLKTTGRVSLMILSGSLYCAFLLEEEGALRDSPWPTPETLLTEILSQGRHEDLQYDSSYGLFYREGK